MLINDAVEKFLTYLEAKGTKQTTRKIYGERLAWLFGFLKVQRLGEVLPEEIDRYVAGMRRDGLAHETVRSRVRDTRIFFSWCVRRGYLRQSPIDHLVIKRAKVQRYKAISKRELKAMIRQAYRMGNKRDIALLLFIAETGCRVGEVVTLSLENLYLDDCAASVNGKTGERWVDFGPKTQEALRDWLACHPCLECGMVFVGKGDKPVTTATIYNAFRRIARACGVKRFNPHSIRHYVGQVYTEQGNLELARQKLGHTDIATTAIYANQDRAKVKEFTNKIDIV